MADFWNSGAFEKAFAQKQANQTRDSLSHETTAGASMLGAQTNAALAPSQAYSLRTNADSGMMNAQTMRADLMSQNPMGLTSASLRSFDPRGSLGMQGNGLLDQQWGKNIDFANKIADKQLQGMSYQGSMVPGMKRGGKIGNVKKDTGKDTVDAKVRPGEYLLNPETVAFMGGGDYNQGVRHLNQIVREATGKEPGPSPVGKKGKAGFAGSGGVGELLSQAMTARHPGARPPQVTRGGNEPVKLMLLGNQAPPTSAAPPPDMTNGPAPDPYSEAIKNVTPQTIANVFRPQPSAPAGPTGRSVMEGYAPQSSPVRTMPVMMHRPGGPITMSDADWNAHADNFAATNPYAKSQPVSAGRPAYKSSLPAESPNIVPRSPGNTASSVLNPQTAAGHIHTVPGAAAAALPPTNNVDAVMAINNGKPLPVQGGGAAAPAPARALVPGYQSPGDADQQLASQQAGSPVAPVHYGADDNFGFRTALAQKGAPGSQLTKDYGMGGPNIVATADKTGRYNSFSNGSLRMKKGGMVPGFANSGAAFYPMYPNAGPQVPPFVGPQIPLAPPNAGPQIPAGGFPQGSPNFVGPGAPPGFSVPPGSPGFNGPMPPPNFAPPPGAPGFNGPTPPPGWRAPSSWQQANVNITPEMLRNAGKQVVQTVGKIVPGPQATAKVLRSAGKVAVPVGAAFDAADVADVATDPNMAARDVAGEMAGKGAKWAAASAGALRGGALGASISGPWAPVGGLVGAGIGGALGYFGTDQIIKQGRAAFGLETRDPSEYSQGVFSKKSGAAAAAPTKEADKAPEGPTQVDEKSTPTKYQPGLRDYLIAQNAMLTGTGKGGAEQMRSNMGYVGQMDQATMSNQLRQRQLQWELAQQDRKMQEEAAQDFRKQAEPHFQKDEMKDGKPTGNKVFDPEAFAAFENSATAALAAKGVNFYGRNSDGSFVTPAQRLNTMREYLAQRRATDRVQAKVGGLYWDPVQTNQLLHPGSGALSVREIPGKEGEINLGDALFNHESGVGIGDWWKSKYRNGDYERKVVVDYGDGIRRTVPKTAITRNGDAIDDEAAKRFGLRTR